MTMFDAIVHGTSVSDAWKNAVMAVYEKPQHHGYHLVVAIDNPDVEDPNVRKLVDALAKREKIRYDAETVASTIFPIGLTAGGKNLKQMTERFLAMYPTLKKFPSNNRGTYFGRMVALPSANGDINQLQLIVDRLTASTREKKTPYQVDILGTDLKTYDAASDKRIPMGFPCLSFCAFQRDHEALHLTAHYRNHYMVERAYGNYLGLGRLLAFIAKEVGLKVGRLTVIAGHAEIDTRPPALAKALAAISKVKS